MGFVVTEIQATPNPNAMKFVLDAMVSEEPASFYSREQAVANPNVVSRLAEKLLAIQGVSNVMLLKDFVTVGKLPQARWSDINGRVKQILAQA
jgi:scaffold Nfu/NifU family protein